MAPIILTAILILSAPGSHQLDPTTVRTHLAHIAKADYGYRGWKCLDRLIHRESRYRADAANPHSSAWGLFQLLRLPPSTTVIEQYARGKRYIEHRYEGAPCRALDQQRSVGWY